MDLIVKGIFYTLFLILIVIQLTKCIKVKTIYLWPFNVYLESYALFHHCKSGHFQKCSCIRHLIVGTKHDYEKFTVFYAL